MRLILVEVHEPGFRVEKLVVVTTLLDADQYPTQAVAELYHYRWNAELDLRAITEAFACLPRKLVAVQFEVIASHEVGNRPNRVEPRAVKRRPKPHRLLGKPRHEAREKLLAAGRQRR